MLLGQFMGIGILPLAVHLYMQVFSAASLTSTNGGWCIDSTGKTHKLLTVNAITGPATNTQCL